MPKNKTCKDAVNIKEEPQFFKNELIEELNRLTQAFSQEINSLKIDAPTTDAPIDKNSSYIISQRGNRVPQRTK